MKRIYYTTVFSLLFFTTVLHGAGIYDFIPRHSQQALQINLNVLQGMKDLRDDMVRNISRHSGIDDKKYNTNEFSDLVETIIIVTPVLTEDSAFILVKTRLPEKEFCSRLEKMTGIRQTAGGPPGAPVHTMTFSGSEIIPGLSTKKRTIAFAFPAPDIAVFTKDDLNIWRQYRELGLPEAKRRQLTVPKALAAGFLETTREFLAANPLLPQILTASYSLSPGPANSLVIKAAAFCADEKTADLTLKQFQQYLMVGGIFLNQLDPELMQDWLTSVRISRDKTGVFLNAFFTRQFLSRLETASQKMSENMKSTEEKKR